MPIDKAVSIKVRGLVELNRALKQLSDKVAGDGLKSAFLGIATTVATRVQTIVPHGPIGRASASVKPHATTRGASISAGGQAAPYFPWLDFGGSVGRGHRVGVGFSGAIKRDWMGRPNGQGRYLYPVISEERDHTAIAVEGAIAEIARTIDFEVR